MERATTRREAKDLAAESERAAELLTKQHLQEFHHEKPPEPPVTHRRWQNMWMIDEDEQERLRLEYEQAVARWTRLKAHDQAEVINTLDAAFADNASHSACIDANRTRRGPYVTLVVHFPGLEIAQGVVLKSQAETRPRNQTEMTDLYRQALASTVIATAKEAFSSAPAAIEAHVIVLRYDIRGRFKKRRSELDAIYSGSFTRSMLQHDWQNTQPIKAVLGASNARVNQDSKGRLKPLGLDAGEDVQRLVEQLRAVSQAGQIG